MEKHNCCGKCYRAIEHVFHIKFNCAHCLDETQIIDTTIEEILGSIAESGWPICSNCGDDLCFIVEE